MQQDACENSRVRKEEKGAEELAITTWRGGQVQRETELRPFSLCITVLQGRRSAGWEGEGDGIGIDDQFWVVDVLGGWPMEWKAKNHRAED